MSNRVSLAYSEKDAKYRSYSLRERLGAGMYLFLGNESKKTGVSKSPASFKVSDYPDTHTIALKTSWMGAWTNASRAVFVNYFNNKMKNKYQKARKDPPKFGVGANQDSKFKLINEHLGSREKSEEYTLALLSASIWNPLAWLEALTLAWANYATLQYDPLKPKGWGFSYLNIMAASFFHALAKTANIVLTPIALVAIPLAVISTGPIGWGIMLGLAGLAAIATVIYHARLHWNTWSPEDGKKRSFLESLGFGLACLRDTLFLGLVSPWIRGYQKLKALYEDKPVLAVLAGFVGVVAVVGALVAVIAIPFLPSVAHLIGQSTGPVVSAIQSMLPVLDKGFLGGKIAFELTRSTLVNSTIVVALALGVADLATRAFKEIAGWWNKGVAKGMEYSGTSEPVMINGEKIDRKSCAVHSPSDSNKNLLCYSYALASKNTGKVDKVNQVNKVESPKIGPQ